MQQLDTILKLPQKISNTLQDGLFIKVSTSELKPVNPLVAATPHIKLFIQCLVERLHVDAQIPRALGAQVRATVRKILLASFYDVNDNSVQCMLEVVDTHSTQQTSHSTQQTSHSTQASEGSQPKTAAQVSDSPSSGVLFVTQHTPPPPMTMRL